MNCSEYKEADAYEADEAECVLSLDTPPYHQHPHHEREDPRDQTGPPRPNNKAAMGREILNIGGDEVDNFSDMRLAPIATGKASPKVDRATLA
jgi:hypothetical protein